MAKSVAKKSTKVAKSAAKSAKATKKAVVVKAAKKPNE